MLARFLKTKFAVRSEHVTTLQMLLMLFFCWGVLLSLNDLLSVAMRLRLHLSYRTALLLQSSYFLACFLSAPLVGRLLERYGYRLNILSGLLVMAGGCVLTAASVGVSLWPVCLLGSLVMGLGINLMQSAAAPMMTHLGDPALGSRRFSFALAFNSMGAAAGPLLGTRWIETSGRSNGASVIAFSYLGLAGALLMVRWLAYRLPKLPIAEERSAHGAGARMRWSSLLGKPALVLGATAMFLYVGAEIGIGGLLIPFEAEAGEPALHAARMLSLYWGGAMLGRFLCVPLLRRPRDLTVLSAVSLAAAVLVLTACVWQHPHSGWMLLPVGLCNAVIVPVLYDRSLEGLGALTPRGAAVMSSMGLGGAVVPQILGLASDRLDIHHAFLLLLLPYAAIAAYAITYTRLPRVFARLSV